MGGANRIALTKLHNSWYEGGIALPNVQLYYWAAHLVAVNGWTFSPQEEPAYRMDRMQMQPRGYNSKLYNPLDNEMAGPTKVTVKIWHEATKALGWANKLTLDTPLWDSKVLGNLITQQGFKNWDLLGISQVRDMMSNGKVKKWEELKQEYQLAPAEIFRFLQIRNALTKILPKDIKIEETSPLESRLLGDPMLKKAVSMTYQKLLHNTPDQLTKLRRKWEDDVQELEDEEWLEALMAPKEIAIRAGFRLIQLKILHRVYYAPTTLMYMGKTSTNLCRRECGQVGTFFHVIWSCPRIQEYWEAVIQCLNEVVKYEEPKSVKLCILNIWDATDQNRMQKIWYALGLMIAKRNIAKNWGAEVMPSLYEWKKDLDWCMITEKVIYEGRGCFKKWAKIWGEWNKYRGEVIDMSETEGNASRINRMGRGR